MNRVTREDPRMARVGEDAQLFQVISVEEDRLRLEARTVTGEVYDSFELDAATQTEPSHSPAVTQP